MLTERLIPRAVNSLRSFQIATYTSYKNDASAHAYLTVSTVHKRCTLSDTWIFLLLLSEVEIFSLNGKVLSDWTLAAIANSSESQLNLQTMHVHISVTK